MLLPFFMNTFIYINATTAEILHRMMDIFLQT